MSEGLVIHAVHPEADGFKDKITPKTPDDSGIFLFKCSCGGVHLRHAGYVGLLLPYLKPGITADARSMELVNKHVMICVSCKKSFMWTDGQMYDLSDRINVQAWEKTEREAHAATGPGGEC